MIHPKYFSKFSFFLTLCIVTILLETCSREEKSIIDSTLIHPRLNHIQLTYSTFHLDTTSNGTVEKLNDTTYKIIDSIQVLASHELGYVYIKDVYYTIYLPNSSKVISFGRLNFNSYTSNDTAIYFSEISLTIQRSDIGVFRVESYAVDRWQNRSNSIIIPLSVFRNNSKPIVYNLEAPDTILRPLTGIRLFTFSISVSDSDGYSDINEVTMQRILPTIRDPLNLYDDGNQLVTGDRFAGDGIFSLIVRIDSTALLGDQVFLFKARDRAGTFSDSLLHTITIIQ